MHRLKISYVSISMRGRSGILECWDGKDEPGNYMIKAELYSNDSHHQLLVVQKCFFYSFNVD